MTSGDPHGAGPPCPEHFALHLPARARYLAIIRELVAKAALEHGFAPLETAKAVMAVDEACVNVIEHAYGGHESATARRIAIRVDARPAELIVTIADRARGRFSPLDGAPGDLESYWSSEEKRGLGLVILRRFVDSVSHSYEPGRGNELRLVKYARSPCGL